MMYHLIHHQMYHVVHDGAMAIKKTKTNPERLIDRCLAAFIEAGTLDVSLDQLAIRVRKSKRMLVHYFGGRESIEEKAMNRLEEKLRAQFAPANFPAATSAETVVMALWDLTTAPQSRGILLLTMDLSRRAWSGSAPAQAFYAEQQRLWVRLLLNFINDEPKVEELLQLFQGAVLAYLVTGNRDPGKRALLGILRNRKLHGRRRVAANARP
jgi:AcrR family transcriptional regulator